MLESFFSNETIWAVLFGLALRFFIVTLFSVVIKVKIGKLPNILGVAAVIWYFVYAEDYSDMEFVNGFVITGMFLPELIGFVKNMFNSNKQSTKRKKT